MNRFTEEMRKGSNELREGQAMLMQYLRELEARREIDRMEYTCDKREMQRQVADLRLDFLNHMRNWQRQHRQSKLSRR